MVSPEVGLTVVPATASGRRFADELGGLNQRLADVCERVVLMVAGQPMTIKEPDAGTVTSPRSSRPTRRPRPRPGRARNR